MPVQPYESSNYKRLFINNPYIKGMYNTELNLDEGTAKSLVNLDIVPSGSQAEPRDSLLNTFLNNGLSYDKIYGANISTRNQSNETFMINCKYVVNEYEFENKLIVDSTEQQDEYPEGTFGLRVFKYTGGFKDNVRDYTRYQRIKEGIYTWIHGQVLDGDTLELKKWSDLNDDEKEFWGYELNYPYYELPETDYDGHRQRVRLLGVDTPEIGYNEDPDEPYAQEFKTQLQNWIDAQTEIVLETEPLMPFNDVFGRRLSWIWGTDDIDSIWDDTKTMANVVQREYDDGGIITNAVFYDSLHYDMRYYDVMDTGVYDAFTSATDINIDFEEASWYSKTMQDKYRDDNDEYVVYIDGEFIYDNESYFTEIPYGTDMLDYYFDSEGEEIYDPVDWDNDSFRIEFLQKEFKDNHQGTHYIAEVQKTHRNAVATIGRVVVQKDGETEWTLRHQGLITFQWDGTVYHVILIKPKEVNVGLWGTLDPSAYNFNVLDDDPFIFEDYFGEEAGFNGYGGPMISNVTIYDDIVANNPKPKSSLSPTDNVSIHPYIAIPETGLTYEYGIRTYLGDDEIVEYENYGTIRPISDGTSRNSDYDIKRQYNFSKLTSGEEVIKMELLRGQGNQSTEEDGGFARFYILDQGDFTINTVFYDGDSITGLLRNEYNINIGITYQGVSGNKTTLHYFWIDLAHPDEPVTPSSVDFTTPALNDTVNFVIKLDLVDAAEPLNITLTYTEEGGLSVNDQASYKFEYDRTMIWEEDVLHTAYSGILRIGQSRNIDENDEIKDYDVRTATDAVAYDRYTIYYGMEDHKHKIQFSLWDDDSMCPIPNGTVVFPEAVIHVHPHRGNIYVFGEDNIYMMHSGLEPHQMFVTKIQHNRSIEEYDKNTIKSVASDVFFISNRKGYLIRSNKYVMSADDVFLIPVTTPVDNILYNPREFMSDRLENSWDRVFNQLEQTVDTSMYVYTSNNIIDIITHNKIKEIQPYNETFYMYIIYQYDLNTRRWTIYDSVFKNEPKKLIKYGNPLGYDLITNDTIITSTYQTLTNRYYKEKDNHDRKQRNHLKYDIADMSSRRRYPNEDEKLYWAENSQSDSDNYENIRPIPVGIDSGNINMNPMHNKRFKKAYFEVINYGGQDVEFYFKFYLDNRNDGDGRTIKIERTDDGTVVAKYIFNPDVTLVVEEQQVDGWSIDNLNIKEILKIEFDAKGKGRIPSFKMDVDATSKFYLGQYGLLFRQKSAK